MDAGALRWFNGSRRSHNVLLFRASEGGDTRAANFCRDGANSSEVTVGGDGKARLQNVHAEFGELVGELELFPHMHAAAGRLLAVAEGGVEEVNLIVLAHVLGFHWVQPTIVPRVWRPCLRLVARLGAHIPQFRFRPPRERRPGAAG